MKTLTSLKSIEGNVQGFILSIVGVAVVLAVGLIVVGQLGVQAGNSGVYHCKDGLHTVLNGSFCRNGTIGVTPSTNVAATVITTIAGNSTASIMTQMNTIPQWIGIIITVALAFIVLGYFYNRM